MKLKTKRSKHQDIVDKLYYRLLEKPWVDEVYRNVEYEFGECDILYRSGKRWNYIEVKSKDHKKAQYKARDQLYRWSNFDNHFYGRPTAGIYYTPDTGPKRIVRNGKYLNDLVR